MSRENNIDYLSLRPEQNPLAPELYRKKSFFKKALAVTALIGTGLTTMGATDIKSNQAIEAKAQISIKVIESADADHPVDTATILINGFGESDADNLIEPLGGGFREIIDDTELWSLNFGNAPLDESSNADEIIETAYDRGIRNVNIIGYSAGGDIEAATIEKVYEKSDLNIPMIVMASTPYDIEGLRPARKEEFAFAKFISKIPYVEHSSFLRFVGEVYFRRDRFANKENLVDRFFAFADTASTVHDEMANDKLPGTWLLIDQVLAIEQANLSSRFKTIGRDDTTRIKPTVLYMGTTDGYDYMVDDKYSGAKVCESASESGLRCYIQNVEGAVHTKPEWTVEQYKAAFRTVAPKIKRSLELNQNQYITDQYIRHRSANNQPASFFDSQS